MGKERSVFVMRVNDDAWRVIRDGDRRPSLVTKSRTEALERATAIASSLGVSVIELNSSGKMTDQDHAVPSTAQARSARRAASGAGS